MVSIKLHRNTLVKALETVVSAVPGKASHAVLKMFYFEIEEEILVVRGFDLSFGIQYRFQLDADTFININRCDKTYVLKFTLPRLTLDLISQLKSEFIELEIDQEDFVHTLKTESTQTKLHALNPEEYPDFPTPLSFLPVKLPTDVFASACKRCGATVSLDATKQVLTGVNIVEKTNSTPTGNYSELHFASTDGHRLAWIVEDASLKEIENFKEGKTFPVTALNEILKIAQQQKEKEIWVSFSEDCLFAEISDKCFVFSRMISGAYPDYQMLFPNSFDNSFVVKRQEFLSGIRYVNTINPANVCLNIVKDKIEIEAQTIDVGTSIITIDGKLFKGEETRLRFNIKYLIDAVRFLTDEIISINYNSPNSCVVFNNYADTHSHYLLMPLNQQQ